MRSRFSKAQPGLAALLMLLAGAALATTVHGPADVATLTKSADTIVRATVVSRAAHWAAGGEKSGQIFTSVELSPSEQWKGPPVDARISVRIPGGELGNLSQEVVGAGTFTPGEEVVVFLRMRAKAGKDHLAVYEVSHWALGKFSLGQATPGAPVQAMRDRSGVECIGCGPSEEDVLPLDELRSQVRAAAKAVTP